MDQADPALQAISQSQVDRYVVLPAFPLEDRLFPLVDDLLGEWFAQHSAAQVGVTVLGHRFSATSYLVKDYLARSLRRIVVYEARCGFGKVPAGGLIAAHDRRTCQ